MLIPNSEAHEISNDSEDPLKSRVGPEVFYQAAIDNLPHWFIRKIRKDAASSCDWLCAAGQGTDLLAQRLNIKVTGLDAADDLIETARSRYARPEFLVANYLDSSIDNPAATYDVVFVINKLQRFANPERVLENIAARAKKYLVVVIPYREYRRSSSHASSFDKGNIPASVAGSFTLIYSTVTQNAAPEDTGVDGEQIVLIYASGLEIPTLGLYLGDLKIGKESVRPEQQLERLRKELKATNQLFLDRTHQLEAKLRARDAELSARNHELSAVRHSTSWRVTSPLRSLGSAAHHGKRTLLSVARLAYRRMPLPAAWKQAVRRSLLGEALRSTPASPTTPQAATQGKWAVAPVFTPPLRGGLGRSDVFVWGQADWHAQSTPQRQTALDMAHRGHRVYFFTPRFGDEEKPGFRLETVTDNGLLNVVYLNVGNPGSIDDLNAGSMMAEALRASLVLFLIQAAPASIISILQHPFWLTWADQVPNRHLIYEISGDYQNWVGQELGLGNLHERAIRAADLVLAPSEALAQQVRALGGNVLLPAVDNDDVGVSRARVIIQNIEQYVPPLVTLVLVTYNKLELTDACLHSLEKNTQYKNFEVIVVDNDSRDSTPEYLREWASRGENRKIILNSDNRGFAAANNQGMKEARGEYLVLLNNDTYVTPGWLGTLVRHLRRNPDIGIVGPVTNNIGNESKIQISYDSMAEMESAARMYTSSHMGEELPLYTAAFFCVAFPRAIYERVGDLDEAFGIGMFEDDDYCRRVQQIGHTVVCAEDVFIHHHHSASFNLMGMERRIKLFNDNRQVYESKWGPWVPHEYREGVKPKE